MFRSIDQVWDDALARNGQALAFLAAELLALLAAYGGADAVSLPRAIHTTIIRVLRPAESALRRLIVMAARDVKVEHVRPDLQPRPLPAKQMRAKASHRSRMSFQLFDPRKRFNAPHVTYTRRTPRVFAISPAAPFSPLFQQPSSPPERPPIPAAADRPVSARSLVLRLKAFTTALDDIPRQAKRMVRWRIRREMQQPPKFFLPLRPGNPPGHRTKAQHEVDDILAECHSFARSVLSGPLPNTS